MQDRSLTVLQLSWSLKTGGLERVVLDLARLGPEFGLRPVVAALTEAGPLAGQLSELGAPLFLLGKRPGIDLRMVPRLAALIRAQGVDVLHAHNQAAAFYAGLAARLCGRPLVTTRHGASFGKDPSHRWLSRVGSLLARYTVCIGQDAYRVSRQVDRIPPGRLRIIYNGVDTERFRPDAQARLAARQELGLTSLDQVLISVGRLSAEKDYATLLEALAQLPPSQAPCLLLMVGDGPERPALERASAELGLGARVRWLGERADVPRLLAAADAFVLSSLSEGVSIAILEALSAGLPVAATQVGGNAEIVEQGLTGTLVPPGQPAALAAALAELLAQPELARSQGLAGRARVQARFSVRAMVGAYAALYSEVAGKARRKA